MNDPTVFAAHRARLFAIAYRMLGVRADAEDVVQDAWIRWQGADTSGVQSAEAWLVTVVTRLSIDRLRAAIAEREAYEGLWLPEPLVAVEQATPELQAERASDLSLAYVAAAAPGSRGARRLPAAPGVRLRLRRGGRAAWQVGSGLPPDGEPGRRARAAGPVAL